MRIYLKMLAFVSMVVFATSVQASYIRVSQESSAGAGDFSSNVLGCIQVYNVGNTLQGYYSYDIPNNVSYGNNPPALVLNRSHLFLVQGTNGLGLFIVHDRSHNGPNGGGQANMDFQLFGDSAAFLVRDDPGDGYSTGGGGTLFNTAHNWVSPNTDGTVIGALDGTGWSMLVDFNSWGGTNSLNSWFANSADGNNIELELEANRRVLLEFCPVPVPAGVQLALLGGGLLACYNLRGLRRKPVLA